MSEYEYYSDEDLSDAEYERRELWDSIKHITLAEYLRCPKTKTILQGDFLQRYHEQLESKIDNIFNRYFYKLKGHGINLMYRAEEKHIGDFSNLVYLNLMKTYNMSIFEENPHLAKPVIEMLENE
jgi:hypothetical protein